jgi:hypothetical protein
MGKEVREIPKGKRNFRYLILDLGEGGLASVGKQGRLPYRGDKVLSA